MPKNRQHNRKTKYPDKVTKPKRLVLVRIFLFCSVGIKIQYFPTAPYFYIYQLIFIYNNSEFYYTYSFQKPYYRVNNQYLIE